MTADASATSRPTRRRDLQGLRAIASLLVATHHIWFASVSGGVDAFFVFGGFLAVTSLLSEVERRGTVDLRAALARQASRLLPTMGIVLVASAVGALALRPLSTFGDTGWDLFAAATFFEHVRLAAASTAYLDVAADRSIVQHFWALGVQTWWVVAAIVVVTLVARAVRGRAVRVVVAVLLGVVAVVSFGLALAGLEAAPDATYFDAGARAWELALGGATALVAPAIRWAASVRIAVAALGVVALLAVGRLPADWLHPGPVTLVPVLATIAVVLAGSGDVDGPVARVLGARPLVWLGDRSFGLYLWHWPVLWVTVELGLVRRGDVGVLGGLAILAISTALAAVTHAALATRAHRARRLAPTRTRIPRSAVLMPAVATMGVVLLTIGPNLRDLSAQATPPPEPVNAAALAADVRAAVEEPGLVDDGASLGPHDRAAEWWDACLLTSEETLEACTVERPDGGPAPQDVWLVGDSHAVSLMPAVEAGMPQSTVRLLASAECAPVDDALLAGVVGAEFADACADHEAWVLDLIAEDAPDVVVLTFGAWWTGGSFPAGTVATIASSSSAFAARVEALGPQVVWIDSPPPARGFQACADAQAVGESSPCTFTVSPSRADRVDAIASAMAAVDVDDVPSLPWLCTPDALECPIVVDGIAMYADPTHLSERGAELLADVVGDAIADVGG